MTVGGRLRTLPIANYGWYDADTTAQVDWATVAEAPQPVRGQFAVHVENGDSHLLARDLLGVNKLFFTVRPDGELLSSNYLIDLVRTGVPIGDIWSVPSGHAVRVSLPHRSYELSCYASLEFNGEPADPASIDAAAARIRQALSQTFSAFEHQTAGRPVYVTMSGGLDSSTVALLARQRRADVIGITFCIADDAGRLMESEDLLHARRLADELGIPLRTVSATPAQIIALLDDVLLYGQDWRDFNVHCGLVNAVIARAIAAETPAGTRPVVLTGDGMNELMSDYTAVRYAGREYYTLPDLGRARLRQFLVRGLDTGDREVGIYARYGIDVIQPYAICASAYLAVPAGLLEASDAKERLVTAVMGEAVPAYIRQRPKVRAQAGGSEELRGTLTVLVDAGIDSEQLKQRFAALMGCQQAELDRLIRAGVYRFTTQFLWN